MLRKISKLVHAFPWFHRWIGVLGNTAFVLGSVFSLFSGLSMASTWVFIIASSGMLIDSFGEKVWRREEDERRTNR